MPSAADQIFRLNVSSTVRTTVVVANATGAAGGGVVRQHVANGGAYVSTVSPASDALQNLSDSLSTIGEEVLQPSFSPSGGNECSTAGEELYPSYFGVELAVPEWEAILTAVILSAIIILTIVGNILVILSVFTYKPLRIVQNFFIVSLAVADLTVALLVLPFNVAYSILGRWEFGIHLCKMWLTCDVMCCTSSILNLCAIALDRYWAITDPINYAQKRTVGRVLLLIIGVWVLSLLISSPPLIGWNDWPEEFTSATPCELTSNRGYVIYSSLGSFVIPLIIMTIVYVEIYVATRRRLRERAQASKINAIALKATEAQATGGGLHAVPTEGSRLFGSVCGGLLCCGRNSPLSATTMIQPDQESFSSDTHGTNETPSQQEQQRVVVVTQRKKSRRSKIKDSIKHGKARAKKQLGAAATAAGAQAPIPNSAQHPNSDEGAGAEQRLLLSATTVTTVDGGDTSAKAPNQSMAQHQPNSEVHIAVCNVTASDQKVYGPPETRIIAATDNEEDSVSPKITPPQSSAGAASTSAVTLQKKPSAVYQFIEEKQKISLSKERRAARTLGIIMGVFVICWLPFFLMYVILPFCDSCCPTNKFKNFITWLGYINSGLNPIIYTIFNLDYRRAFKRLLGLN